MHYEMRTTFEKIQPSHAQRKHMLDEILAGRKQEKAQRNFFARSLVSVAAALALVVTAGFVGANLLLPEVYNPESGFEYPQPTAAAFPDGTGIYSQCGLFIGEIDEFAEGAIRSTTPLYGVNELVINAGNDIVVIRSGETGNQVVWHGEDEAPRAEIMTYNRGEALADIAGEEHPFSQEELQMRVHRQYEWNVYHLEDVIYGETVRHSKRIEYFDKVSVVYITIAPDITLDRIFINAGNHVLIEDIVAERLVIENINQDRGEDEDISITVTMLNSQIKNMWIIGGNITANIDASEIELLTITDGERVAVNVKNSEFVYGALITNIEHEIVFTNCVINAVSINPIVSREDVIIDANKITLGRVQIIGGTINSFVIPIGEPYFLDIISGEQMQIELDGVWENKIKDN
jgi:hypothetical protein